MDMRPAGGRGGVGGSREVSGDRRQGRAVGVMAGRLARSGESLYRQRRYKIDPQIVVDLLQQIIVVVRILSDIKRERGRTQRQLTLL
jgi:hypothetical protein